MLTQTISNPIHVESNPLGEFTFFEDYVIAEWQNPEIDSFDLVKMETVSQSIYGNRIWGYISNRTHAAVSNPSTVYQMLQKKCAPRAVAIVTYSIRSLIVAKLEKEHCKAVPLEIFNQLKDAEQWMRAKIEHLQQKEDSERFA